MAVRSAESHRLFRKNVRRSIAKAACRAADHLFAWRDRRPAIGRIRRIVSRDGARLDAVGARGSFREICESEIRGGAKSRNRVVMRAQRAVHVHVGHCTAADLSEIVTAESETSG